MKRARSRTAPRRAPTRRRVPAAADILAFAAHPDDAELGCGGLMARMAARGRRVVVVDLTRGELSTAGDVTTRARESEEAAAILGLAGRCNLALPDGGLSHLDREQLRSVVAAIREFRPRILLAPHPRCTHPDHVEAGLLAARAAHLAGIRRWSPGREPARPGAFITFESRVPLEPSFLVDVSAVWALKRRAIACHASQFRRARRGPRTGLNDPGFLAAHEARARWLGSLLGVAAAEPYCFAGPLPVDDPLLLFGAAPGPVGRVWGG